MRLAFQRRGVDVELVADRAAVADDAAARAASGSDFASDSGSESSAGLPLSMSVFTFVSGDVDLDVRERRARRVYVSTFAPSAGSVPPSTSKRLFG